MTITATRQLARELEDEKPIKIDNTPKDAKKK